MKTLVVDGHYLLYRNFFSPSWELSTADNFQTGGTFVFLKSLHYTLESLSRIGRVVVVWDGRRSARRLELYPSYKANRGNDGKITPEVREGFAQQQSMLNEFFQCLGVKVAYLPTKEGDDTIYFLSRYLPESVILSDDKDMLSMIRKDTNIVTVFRPSKSELIDYDKFLEEYGFPPQGYIYWKAIVGDKSDNIDGVDGAGKKTASTFCQILHEHRGEVAYTHEQVATSPDRRLRLISEQWSVVERNRRLVDCKFEPFSPEEAEQIRNVVEADVSFDIDKFLQLCDKYRFLSLTGNAWSTPFRRLK